jgi:signal transduction histidine kinase
MEDAREDLKDFDLMRLLRRVSDSLRDTLGHLSEVALLHTSERVPLSEIQLNTHVHSAIEAVSGDLRRDDVEIINEINGTEVVKAIPAYLDSILLNLLTNAVKYRSKERPCLIRITATCEGRYLMLTVSDNGLGIDIERHGAKLFGMFKTFHDHPEARGIGLFITKNQVEAIGGRIDVESVENEGTSFHVRLLKAD